MADLRSRMGTLAAVSFLYVGALCAAEYQAASPEPTPEETLMVEFPAELSALKSRAEAAGQ